MNYNLSIDEKISELLLQEIALSKRDEMEYRRAKAKFNRHLISRLRQYLPLVEERYHDGILNKTLNHIEYKITEDQHYLSDKDLLESFIEVFKSHQRETTRHVYLGEHLRNGRVLKDIQYKLIEAIEQREGEGCRYIHLFLLTGSNNHLQTPLTVLGKLQGESEDYEAYVYDVIQYLQYKHKSLADLHYAVIVEYISKGYWKDQQFDEGEFRNFIMETRKALNVPDEHFFRKFI